MVPGQVLLPTTPLGGDMQTRFDFIGGGVAWTVPFGVTSVQWQLYGAPGGRSQLDFTKLPAAGGKVSFSMATTAGQGLVVIVGGRGGDGLKNASNGGAGGYALGGHGGGAQPAQYSGAGGGGCTELHYASVRIGVAGGSGGNAAGVGGVAIGGMGGNIFGGSSSQDGQGFYAGHAAGPGATGGAATSGATYNGTAGSSVQQGGLGGGNVAAANFAGGGGGGEGYAGGGGGGASGAHFGSAGGGGNSFAAASTSMGPISNVNHVLGGGATYGSDGFAIARYKVPPFPPQPTDPIFDSLIDSASSYIFRANYFCDTDMPVNHFATDFRYRIQGTSVWTTVPNVNTDTSLINFNSITWTIAAGTFLPSQLYEWQARSRNTDLVTYSDWCDSATFDTSVIPPTPKFVTPLDGAVITKLPMKVQWTSVNQLGYQLQQLDSGMNVLWDSGILNFSSKLTEVRPSGIGITGFFQLRINNGVSWSAWEVINLSISLTPDVDPPSAIGMETLVYDQNQVFIGIIPDAIAPSFLDQLNGPNGGSFGINLDSPTLARYPHIIDTGNIVRVKDGGEFIGFWIINKIASVVVDQGESINEIITCSGTGGYGAWFPNAIVYPEDESTLGLPLNILGNTRMFGFGSSQFGGGLSVWYDAGLWSHSYVLSVQSNTTKADGLHTTGNPFTAVGGPTLPDSWPDPTANWIWWRDSRSNEETGTAFFRHEFSVPSGPPVQVQLSAAAENSFIAFLDGNNVLTGTDWQTTQSTSSFYLAPGNHVLAFVVAKDSLGLSAPAFSDPAGLIFALIQLADPVSGAGQVTLAKSEVLTMTAGYPGIAPGWTAGDILHSLVLEASSRNVSGYQTLYIAFDPFVDTYGKPWQRALQYEFNLGDTYASVVDQLTQNECDVWFDAEFSLCAAPSRGFDRGISDLQVSYVGITNGVPARYWVRFNSPIIPKMISVLGQTAKSSEVIVDNSSLLALVPFDEATLNSEDFFAKYLEFNVQGEPFVSDLSLLHSQAENDQVVFYLIPDPDGGLGSDRIAFPVTPHGGFAFEWISSGPVGLEYFSFDNSVDPTVVNWNAGLVAPLVYYTISMLEYDSNSTLIQVRINLCTNPYAAINTTGWLPFSFGTLPTLSRDTTVYMDSNLGTSFKVSNLQAGVVQGDYYTLTGLTVGETYTASVWILRDGGSPALKLLVTSAVGSDTVLVGTWERISVTWVATATNHNVQIETDGAVTTGSQYWHSHMMAEHGSTLGDWVDPSYPVEIFSRKLIGVNISTPDQTYEQTVSIEADIDTHHFICQVIFGGGSDLVQLYQDSQLLLSMTIPTGFIPSWLIGVLVPCSAATNSGCGSIGEIAYYDQYFTPGEIINKYDSALGNLVAQQPVIMSKGKNVVAAGSEQQLQSVTAMLVKSSTSFFETTTPDPDSTLPRVEAFYDGSSKSNDDARSVADITLQGVQVLTSATLEILGGYVPWRDFGVGDWILAPSDTDPTVTRRRVVSISGIPDTDMGITLYTLELDTISQDPDRRLATWLERVTPSGSLGGLIAGSG